MPADFYRFRHFIVRQTRATMKSGTDGVLLGAWADITSAGNILDIGCGTGLLSLLCAQRNPNALIDAVDLETGAVEDTTENVDASPWAERIHIHHSDIQAYTPDIRYDAIICNPPYFGSHTHIKNVNTARQYAKLPPSALIKSIKRLLSEQGAAYLVLPVTEGELFIKEAISMELYPKETVYVITREGKSPMRILLKLSHQPGEPTKSTFTLFETDGETRTEAFHNLTRDIYLQSFERDQFKTVN